MPVGGSDARAELIRVLERARERSFLGPGPVIDHVALAADLAECIGHFSGSFLDLGSGGGVPGLVLALEWPDARGALLESRQRGCAFLRRACRELGLERRTRVECGRAEELARDPRLRGAFELVTARSFGPPAVTAECGVGFLCPGGRLVVTEPPAAGAEGAGRWPRAGLDALGLAGPQRYAAGGVSAAVLTLAATADDRWPRRTGIVAKRPLWR
jgi:16S rRNA (guanine527-N7)-methyltransferase